MPQQPPLSRLRFRGTHRLIPSRYPATGILDAMATVEELASMIELAGWTSDRVSAELGIIRSIPPGEWVLGRSHATLVMAAFCHPRPSGGRFNDAGIGAWYAAVALQTAHAEAAHHRAAELAEVGISDARLEMRQYRADFDAAFHDVRADTPANRPLHDPDSYRASQALAARLRDSGVDGIAYRSVRHPGGTCLACFRPPLVRNVRPGAQFEYRWSGRRMPTIRALA